MEIGECLDIYFRCGRPIFPDKSVWVGVMVMVGCRGYG